MRRYYRLLFYLSAVAALALLLSSRCRQPQGEPPAAALLPNLPGYNQLEGQTLTGYIGALAQGAALLAGQPQLALTLGAVDQIAGCYQDVGAVRIRLYSHADNPLQAGAAAVADRRELDNPENLFHCLALVDLGLEGEQAEQFIAPCTGSYTLRRDDNEFYIAFAGTTTAMCRDLCDRLDGCQWQANQE